MFPFKTILCPTDFSEPSREALKIAEKLARHFSAKLHLLHVITPVPLAVPTTGALAIDFPSYQKKMEKSARDSLRTLVEEVFGGKADVEANVVLGEAADEIVRASEEKRADLVLLATHGYTGWRHLVFGSVAEKVIRLSKKPVLTIREPAASESRDAEPSG